jgi:hypothetical protein
LFIFSFSLKQPINIVDIWFSAHPSTSIMQGNSESAQGNSESAGRDLMQGNSGGRGTVLMPENGGMPGNSGGRGTVLMPEHGGMPGNSGGRGKYKRSEFSEVEREDMREALLANCIAEGRYDDQYCKFNPQQLAILWGKHRIIKERAIEFAKNFRKRHTVEQRPLDLRTGRQLKQVY